MNGNRLLPDGKRAPIGAPRAQAYCAAPMAFCKPVKWLLQLVVLLAASGAVAVPAATAQAGMQRATRAELAEHAQVLEQALTEKSLKGSARTRSEDELSQIRERLAAGDFKVGDRFVVTLNFDSVTTDTASVREGIKVSLFNLPELDLTGVLRSELGDKLNAHVVRYLRNASVRANVLTRVGILGAVARPGYYLASPDRPVSELIMLAGGPAPDANMSKLKVERGNRTILSTKDSQRAIKDGTTLDQLDIQSGDNVTIAKKRKLNWQLIVQVAFIASSLLFTFIQLMQWYYRRDDY